MNRGQPAIHYAPAKVNLWLSVGQRRADGYHSVDTVFLALGLADEISLSPANQPGLQVDGDASVPAGEDNLCWRVQELFAENVPAARGRPQRIHLRKRIPAGAGLGGGSADAAAVLSALNEAFGTPLSPARLRKLGAELGSDVPFFLSGSPMAIGSDRGQDVVALPAPPVRPVLILVPNFGISTAQAYGWLDQDRGPEPILRASSDWAPDERAVLSGWEGIKALAANDFEAPVFRRFPVLEAGKSGLLEADATVALLCGRGSCLFGVFESSDDRDREALVMAAETPTESTFRPIATHTMEPSQGC